jgi:hypothetical protein
MAQSSFESTWVPRIGENATSALRRYAWAAHTVPVTLIVLGVAASYAFSGGTLDVLLGVVLVAAWVGVVAIFLRTQRRLAAVLSEWFGAKITGGRLPRMNPKRFDAWCEERGLRHPGEQVASGQAARASDAAAEHSG